MWNLLSFYFKFWVFLVHEESVVVSFLKVSISSHFAPSRKSFLRLIYYYISSRLFQPFADNIFKFETLQSNAEVTELFFSLREFPKFLSLNLRQFFTSNNYVSLVHLKIPIRLITQELRHFQTVGSSCYLVFGLESCFISSRLFPSVIRIFFGENSILFHKNQSKCVERKFIVDLCLCE